MHKQVEERDFSLLNAGNRRLGSLCVRLCGTLVRKQQSGGSHQCSEEKPAAAL